MKTNLKLVHSATSAVNPRPFRTFYYRGTHTKISDWSRVGHAGSPVGAIRAAVVKLVIGQYSKAIVHGEDGEVQYTITRSGQTIKVFGQFMEFQD